MGGVYRRRDKKPLPSNAQITQDNRGRAIATWTIRGVTYRRPVAPCGTKYIRKDDHYSVSYTPHDGGRPIRIQTNYTDKEAATRYLRILEQEEEDKRRGVFDETKERLTKARLEDIEQHVRDYLADLENNRRSPRHIAEVGRKLRAICEAAGIRTFADLQLSRAREGIATLCEKRRLSDQTFNHHVAALKGFINWAYEDDRIDRNPLKKLKQMKVQRRVRERRVLSFEEFERLLEAARSRSRPNMKLPSSRRVLFYLTLAATGFRLREAASLTPEHFTTDGDELLVNLQASDAKNRRSALKVVPATLREPLSNLISETPKGERLFQLPCKPAKYIQRDLAAARKQWVSEAATEDERRAREASDFLQYRTGVGVYADMHSLRAAYCTLVQRLAPSQKAMLDAQRHSDMRVAARYWHATDNEQATLQHRIGDHLPTPPIGREPAGG